MPQIVWTAGPDGKVDYYNRRWYEYTGMPHGGPGEGMFEAVLHADDVERCSKRWHDSMRSGRDYQIEYRFRDAEGRYRWHLGRACAVRDALGRVVRWVGTATDIEEFKRLESELEGRVRERTEELDAKNKRLERFQRITVGREHDMIRLKKEINVLMAKLGQPNKYFIASSESSAVEDL